MRSFTIFVTIIFMTFFFFGYTTKEEQARNELESLIIPVLEEEARAGMLRIYRAMEENPTDAAGKVLVEAINKGYLSKGPLIRGYNDGRYWINKGSVPAIVEKQNILTVIADNVRFEITNNPVMERIGPYEFIFVEFKYKGKITKFGKFLKKGGFNIPSEGVGSCNIGKKDDGWHIDS